MSGADFSQIRSDFKDYLVEKHKISKYRKDITTKQLLTTYQDDFKKFLKTRDDINEDTFTKNSIDAENEDLSYLDEMFDDLLDSVKKSDAIFKLADKDGNGELSEEEKNEFKENFFDKISKLDEDGDDDITSFDEFTKAISGLSAKADSEEYQNIASLFDEDAGTTEHADKIRGNSSSGGGGGGGGTPGAGGTRGANATNSTNNTNAASGGKLDPKKLPQIILGQDPGKLKTAFGNNVPKYKENNSKRIQAQAAAEAAKQKRVDAEAAYGRALDSAANADKQLTAAKTAYDTATKAADAKEQECIAAKQKLEEQRAKLQQNQEKVEALKAQKSTMDPTQYQNQMAQYKNECTSIMEDVITAQNNYFDALGGKTSAYADVSTKANALNKHASDAHKANTNLTAATKDMNAAAQEEAAAAAALYSIDAKGNATGSEYLSQDATTNMFLYSAASSINNPESLDPNYLISSFGPSINGAQNPSSANPPAAAPAQNQQQPAAAQPAAAPAQNQQQPAATQPAAAQPASGNTPSNPFQSAINTAVEVGKKIWGGIAGFLGIGK